MAKATVQAAHAELKAALERARENRKFVVEAAQHPAFAKVLTQFERDIESDKELLTGCETKEVPKLQGAIRAGRALLGRIAHAYETDVEEAKRALDEFEKQNALLVQAPAHALTKQA